MTPIVPRAADYRDFGTVQRTDEFDVDWAEFYRRGARGTDHVRREYRHEAGVVYGTSPFHVIDLYLPTGVDGPVPVFAFVHGGAFREGHPYYYGYLARPYLEAGFAFASIGYRLLPDAGFPDTAADLVRAVRWLHTHGPTRGIDPAAIVVGGHSAGAMLTALLAVRGTWQADAGLPTDVIAGNVLVSGYYDFREDFPGNHIADPAQRISGSPICQVDAAHPPAPTVISFGPTELNWKRQISGHYAASSTEFAAALTEAGTRVTTVPLPGANHDDTAHAMSDPASPLTMAILRLLGEVRGVQV